MEKLRRSDYGITEDELGVSLAIVAEEPGVSRERARQIEASALKKLRKYCKLHSLEPKDFLDTEV